MKAWLSDPVVGWLVSVPLVVVLSVRVVLAANRAEHRPEAAASPPRLPRFRPLLHGLSVLLLVAFFAVVVLRFVVLSD